MIPDIEYLKKHCNQYGFSSYSTAYVATNEDLRNALKCMSKNTKRALTVASSGDHPMFTKLYGAKHIDTFDISFNAKLIMDIKTNALSLLGHEEYCQLLNNLYESNDIAHTKNMPQIIKALTPFEQRYIKKIRGIGLFNKHLYTISVPTKTEYQQMQQVIKKPFNFIWADIQTLHQNLNRTYDFIHLSNIFDYVGTQQNCINILYSLIPYTVPGCNICITCFTQDTKAICEEFIRLQKLQSYKGQIWTANNVQNMDDTYVLQRVR